MNMKRTLVLLMTFVMLIGAFTPTLSVFATAGQSNDSTSEKTELNYVSLGDSMTNGIGMDGYDSTEHNGYLEVAPDSYPAQFKDWLEENTGKNVNLTQLATSAVRVEDMYYILNHGTENAVPADFWTQRELLYNYNRWGHKGGKWCEYDPLHEEFNNEVAETYRDAVADADIISLATGNGNFGVFLMGRIMNLVGFGNAEELALDYEHYGHYSLEAGLDLLEADDETRAIVTYAYESAMAQAEEMGLPMTLVERVGDLAAYVTASYLHHTMKVIDLIVEMNPDVTIVIVPLINNGQGFTMNVDGTTVDMGDFLAKLYNPINDFLAIYPTVQQYKGNYEDATFLYASLPEDDKGEEIKVETFAQAFDKLYAPLVDTDEDGVITEEEFPTSRLFCHNRFYSEIQYFVMPILLGGVDSDYEDKFDEYDIRDYEIAKANGTATFAAYALANADKVQLIAYYLGIVDAVLAAMSSTPVVDSSEIAMPEGEFDMFALLGPAVGDLKTELPQKVEENANAVAERLAYDLVAANITPILEPYFSDAGFLYVFGADLEIYGDDSVEKTLQMIYLTGAMNGSTPDSRFEEYGLQEMRDQLIGGYNQIIAGLPSLAQLTVLPDTLSEGLGSVGLLNALLALYGRLKLATGLSAHPSANGHDTLTESLTIGYTEGVLEAKGENGMPAELVLEKFYNLYATAAEYGFIGDLPELAVVEEIYEYLDGEDYITDEQTLDIILCAYTHIEDKKLSDEDTKEIAQYTYETLVRNPLLNDTERVEIIGNVYFILKENHYLNKYTALETVEEIYAALDAEDLITDEQSYAIVDYVYDVVIDGELTNEELFDVVKFIFNTLVKDETVRPARKRAQSAQNDAEAAKTLRIVLGVLAKNYLDEENQKSVETLITGEGALINDALLIKLVDNAIADVENSEADDMATIIQTVSTNAIQTVLDDPNTDASTKTAIVGEIKKVADSNDIIDDDTSSVYDEVVYLVNKIYKNLNAEGLMGEAEKEAIVNTLIDRVVLPMLSGKTLTTDDVIAIVLDVADVIFGREDLTVEQKVQILVVTYETLDEEGYITEENAMIIAGLVAEYYDEAYFEAYKYLDEKGYIDVAVMGVDEAIEAIYLAIKEVEAGLLGVTDELKAEMIKELYATIETLKELREVLATDGAKDVEGFINTVFELEDDLYTHLNNIYAILRQGSIDINQIILLPAFKEAMHILETEVIPAIKEAIEVFTQKFVEYLEEKLGNAVAPIIRSYIKLLAICTKICDTIKEAIEMANEIYEKLLAINDKLNGALTYAMDQVIDLFIKLYEAYGNVEDALLALNNILMNIVNTAEETIEKVIAAYNALVDKLVEIYGTIEAAVEKAYEIYNEIVATVNGAIEKGLEIYNAILDILVNAYGTLENVVTVASQIFSYVYDFVADNYTDLAKMFKDIVAIVVDTYGATKDAYYTAEKVYAYLVNAFASTFEAYYVVTNDSKYVSLGNAVYGEELAEMLQLADKYNNFALNEDYLEEIADADLITVRFDNGELIDFVIAQLNNPTELDWSKHLDAEGQKALDEVLADIKAELLANGKAQELADTAAELVELPGVALTPVIVADVIAYAIECTLYNYAEFIDRVTVTLDNVYATAPEAIVVITGIQNPLAELDLAGLGFDIDLGEYAQAVDYVVKGLNVQLMALAFVNENTIFVDSNEAEDIYDALNVEFNLVEAPVCPHEYDDCEDTICNLCGEERVAPGHSFTNYVYNNDATCGVNGTETAKCDNCNAENTREANGTALEHKYGDWVVVREATTEATGLKERTCEHCGHKETEEIPMLLPTPTPDSDTAPDNTAYWIIAAVVCLLALCIFIKKPAGKKVEGANTEENKEASETESTEA